MRALRHADREDRRRRPRHLVLPALPAAAAPPNEGPSSAAEPAGVHISPRSTEERKRCARLRCECRISTRLPGPAAVIRSSTSVSRVRAVAEDIEPECEMSAVLARSQPDGRSGLGPACSVRTVRAKPRARDRSNGGRSKHDRVGLREALGHRRAKVRRRRSRRRLVTPPDERASIRAAGGSAAGSPVDTRPDGRLAGLSGARARAPASSYPRRRGPMIATRRTAASYGAATGGHGGGRNYTFRRVATDRDDRGGRAALASIRRGGPRAPPLHARPGAGQARSRRVSVRRSRASAPDSSRSATWSWPSTGAWRAATVTGVA